MEFCPRLDKAALSPGNRTGNQFHGIKAEYRHVVLVIGVQVWQMVRLSDLEIHANDDAEEAAQLRHAFILYRGDGYFANRSSFVLTAAMTCLIASSFSSSFLKPKLPTTRCSR